MQTAKKQSARYPISQRKYEIDGKRFVVTRHFTGDRDLTSIMTEIAANRASKETRPY